MADYGNPLAGFNAGVASSQNLLDTFTRARAGRALSGGDFKGGASALFRGGLLDEGAQAHSFGQAQEDRRDDRQRQEVKERLEFFAKASQALAQIPDDGTQQYRRAALQRLVPTLQAMGIKPQDIDQLSKADLSDQSLAMFGAQMAKQLEEYTLAPGSARYRGDRKIAEQPFAPELRSVAPGETLVEVNKGGASGPTPQQSIAMLTGMGARITSGFRTPQRNAAVGGVPSSRHMAGDAVDMVPPVGMDMKAFERQVRAAVPAGAEVINEGDHVHVEWGQAAGGGARVVAQGAPKPEDPMKSLQMQNLQDQMEERQQKRADAATKREASKQAQAMKAEQIIATVDDALEKVGPMTVGFVGGNLSGVKGLAAYDLARDVETIKANLGFQELQEMRAASPTGGALGQVAVQELVALQATVANLDTGQSEAQLRANLNKIKRHYQRWLGVVQQAERNPDAPLPPKVGEVRRGYRYKGGDPSKPASWVKAQ